MASEKSRKMKKLRKSGESGWAAKADWRGEGKGCFGAVGRLEELSGLGAFWRFKKPSETA